MNFEQFGDVRIFRPSYEIEDFIRKRGRTHLFSRFSAGEYRGAEAANAVIQHQFKFYEKLLSPIIPKLASRGAAEFLLFQYDEAVRLLHGNGILDLRERERWEWVEPLFKRAIKYLVELICLNSSGHQSSMNQAEALFAMESAVVCAECMAHLAQESDLTHSVFPENCVVQVFDSGPLDFKISIEGVYTGYDRTFTDRVIRDRGSRYKFVGFPQFDNHTATHQKYLDDSFIKSFGISYGEFIAGINAVINDCQPSLQPETFPTLFVHRGRVIDELAKSGRPQLAIERAIDGFSISATNLTTENRVIWKPKQENRAYRRGFFVFPHETGHHLAFSRAMARENLIQLVNWVSYKHLPAEWETPETVNALAKLAHAAGDWFEEVVSKNLNSLGIVGQRVKRTIGSSQTKIKIPDSIGEIDFLGFNPQQQTLVLVESKMVMTGLEACYWRDDLDEFVFRSGSYAERFRRKLSWVKENQVAISAALGFDSVTKIGAAVLTLYPCIARAFIPDFPCVSITEFMLDHQHKSQWPY